MKSQYNTPRVEFTRVEYQALLPQWLVVRDCIAGETRIKQERTKYLPMPNPTNNTKENLARYAAYLQRAVFYNVTERTLNGLMGQVMSEDPKTELPDSIKQLESDTDGLGTSLTMLAQRTLRQTLAFGRCGLMADYPTMQDAGEVTRQKLLYGEIRPTITRYDPWDIINWRTITIGGITKLALVVISEQYVTNDDGFEMEFDNMWRVLRLDTDGYLVMEEWIQDPKQKLEYILRPLNAPGEVAQYFPTDKNGNRLDFIPFVFCGAIDNTPTPEIPPLGSMASLNIAHYRNSADYEEACFIAGQPTPVFTGMTEEWVKNQLGGVVELGSRAAISLPVGASATLLQAQPNIMPKEAMQQKRDQMLELGAKLITSTSVQRTATATLIENSAETSVLTTIANNVSQAISRVLLYAMNFVDDVNTKQDPAEADIIFSLNTNFSANYMSAQDISALVSTWTSGAITDEEMRHKMTAAGWANEDFERWKEAKEESDANRHIVPFGNAALPATTPDNTRQQ